MKKSLSASLALLALSASSVTAAQASTIHGMGVRDVLASTPSITFATKVTMVHQSLPLFRLSRTSAPTAFVSKALANGGVRALATERQRLVSRDEKGVMHAYADPVTGDAQIFPDITPSRGAATHNSPSAIATSVFADTTLIPKDATTIRLGDPTPVFGGSARRGPNNTSIGTGSTQLYFTYVPAIRYADGLRVFGEGSRATVAVGTDGSIRGLVRFWEAASPAGSVAPTTTAQQLTDSIAAQVGPYAKDARIIVNSVTPAYYDNNQNYLQPVYQFFVTIRPLHGGSDDHMRGYVPFGNLVEPIPVHGNTSAPPPTFAHMALQKGGAGHNGGPSQITLGEYANDDGTMQDQANNYFWGFDAYPGWTYGPPVNRTQWFWAETWQYYANANSYVNDVQIAYTSPHGNWWVNSTNGHNGGDFYISNIGTGGNPGYGSSSTGSLVTWIIDSCEVAPSMYDLQYTTGNPDNAFNNWWAVFQGLHRVLAYRTEMLLGEDSMNYDIAEYMEEGAAVVSGYYNQVASFGFGTYLDTHLGLTVHYDRTSVMWDPRNAGESMYSLNGQSPSTALRNSWMGN